MTYVDNNSMAAGLVVTIILVINCYIFSYFFRIRHSNVMGVKITSICVSVAKETYTTTAKTLLILNYREV